MAPKHPSQKKVIGLVNPTVKLFVEELFPNAHQNTLIQNLALALSSDHPNLPTDEGAFRTSCQTC